MIVSTTWEKALTTAGFALLIIFVFAVVLLRNSPHDTGQRELAFGMRDAASWLEIIWFGAAAVLAAIRRRATAMSFRIILVLNSLVVSLLLGELLRYLLTRA